MSRDRSGKWMAFSDQEGIRKHLAGLAWSYRIKHIHWKVPGWYWVETYTQRCPRNCCDDNVIEFTYASVRATDIAHEIKELAESLKEAREKST